MVAGPIRKSCFSQGRVDYVPVILVIHTARNGSESNKFVRDSAAVGRLMPFQQTDRQGESCAKVVHGSILSGACLIEAIDSDR